MKTILVYQSQRPDYIVPTGDQLWTVMLNELHVTVCVAGKHRVKAQYKSQSGQQHPGAA